MTIDLGEFFRAKLHLLFLRCELRRVKIPFAVLNTGETGFDGVVIDLWNGIELVIVTAGAPNGKTKKGAAGRAYHIVQLVSALGRGQDRVGTFDLIPGTADEKSGRGVLPEKIAGELFDYETIVRFVRIESADDVIPIPPGGCAG